MAACAANEMCGALAHELEAYRNGAEQADDMTLLLVAAL